jgi:hypothetical protein
VQLLDPVSNYSRHGTHSGTTAVTSTDLIGAHGRPSALCDCVNAVRPKETRAQSDTRAVSASFLSIQTDSDPRNPRRNLLHGINLRQNANQISFSSFNTRKNQLATAYREGAYLKDPENKGKPPANPMTDPAGMDQMMNMLKGNMAMMVPQTLIMGWINAFFSGFIIMKLPFPLTIRFKSMLQSGVMTRDLDVRWVSSLSWYFLNLFGLRAVFNFILGNDNCMITPSYPCLDRTNILCL